MTNQERTYTENEVRTILEILEAEKKSVRNLRRRLADTDKKVPSDLIEVERLKKELERSKREYEQKLKEASPSPTQELRAQKELIETLQFDFQAASHYLGELQTELQKQKKDNLEQKRFNLEQEQLENQLFAANRTIQLQAKQLEERNQFEDLVQDFKERHRLAEESIKQLEMGRERQSEQLKSSQEEKKAIALELIEVKQNAQKLEKTIQYLKRKSDDTEKEFNQLSEQKQCWEHETEEILTLQDQCALLKKENQDLQERLVRAEDVEKKYEALCIRNETLENDFSKACQKLGRRLQTVAFEQDFLVLAEQLRERLSMQNAQLEEYGQRFFLTQSLYQNQCEVVSQLKFQLQTLQEEKTVLQQVLDETQTVLEKQAEVILDKHEKLLEITATSEQQIHALETELKDTLEVGDSLLESKKKLEIDLETAEKSLQETKENLEQKSQNLADVHADLQLIREERSSIKAQLEEKDAQLKIAQQHLARRIKEIAELKSLLEEEKVEGDRLSSQMSLLNAQLDEIKKDREQREISRRAKENELEEKNRLLEARTYDLSRERVLNHEKIKELEERLSYLEQIEMRFQHLQKLFATIGEMTVMPKAAAVESPKVVEEEIVLPKIEEPKVEKKEETETLFATTSSTAPRFRDSFFED